jgi:hypothetical protein
VAEEELDDELNVSALDLALVAQQVADFRQTVVELVVPVLAHHLQDLLGLLVVEQLQKDSVDEAEARTAGQSYQASVDPHLRLNLLNLRRKLAFLKELGFHEADIIGIGLPAEVQNVLAFRALAHKDHLVLSL